MQLFSVTIRLSVVNITTTVQTVVEIFSTKFKLKEILLCTYKQENVAHFIFCNLRCALILDYQWEIYTLNISTNENNSVYLLTPILNIPFLILLNLVTNMSGQRQWLQLIRIFILLITLEETYICIYSTQYFKH